MLYNNSMKDNNHKQPGRPALYEDPKDVLFRTEESIIKRALNLYPGETKSRALHKCLSAGVAALEASVEEGGQDSGS